jgi:hypothetical protein
MKQVPPLEDIASKFVLHSRITQRKKSEIDKGINGLEKEYQMLCEIIGSSESDDSLASRYGIMPKTVARYRQGDVPDRMNRLLNEQKYNFPETPSNDVAALLGIILSNTRANVKMKPVFSLAEDDPYYDRSISLLNNIFGTKSFSKSSRFGKEVFIFKPVKVMADLVELTDYYRCIPMQYLSSISENIEFLRPWIGPKNFDVSKGNYSLRIKRRQKGDSFLDDLPVVLANVGTFPSFNKSKGWTNIQLSDPDDFRILYSLGLLDPEIAKEMKRFMRKPGHHRILRAYDALMDNGTIPPEEIASKRLVEDWKSGREPYIVQRRNALQTLDNVKRSAQYRFEEDSGFRKTKFTRNAIRGYCRDQGIDFRDWDDQDMEELQIEFRDLDIMIPDQIEEYDVSYGTYELIVKAEEDLLTVTSII